MTKGELIRFLEPFTDDIEVIVLNGNEWRSTSAATYAQRAGEGLVVVALGGSTFAPDTMTALRR